METDLDVGLPGSEDGKLRRWKLTLWVISFITMGALLLCCLHTRSRERLAKRLRSWRAIGGPQTRGGPRLIDGGADTPPQRRSRRASRVPVASASNVAVGEIVVERMSASSQNEAVGQNLDALLAMGYTDQSAVAALAHTGGFLEPAIELLSADPEFGKRP